MNNKDVLDIAEAYDSNRIPLDTFVIDMDVSWSMGGEGGCSFNCSSINSSPHLSLPRSGTRRMRGAAGPLTRTCFPSPLILSPAWRRWGCP